MTNLLAVLMAVSLPSSLWAQSYGAAEPQQQTETGAGVDQPPVESQRQVTGSTINNFMPMRAPAAMNEEAPRASSPAPAQPAKTSAPRTQQCANSNYEVISTKSGQRCSPKCASGETRDQSTGTCKKANQTPQMAPPAGGGGDDSKSSAAGADKGGALGQEKQDLQEMPKDIQKGQCGEGGGICGNTDREKKVADKYVQFQGALEPGDGTAMPPSSPQSVGSLKGELGTIRTYHPRSLAQKVETARSKIEGAKGGLEAVQIDFSKQSAALAGSYTGIKLNEAAEFKGRDQKTPTTKGAKPAAPTDFKKQSQEVQAKIDALKSALEDLKAKLGKMCGASLETAQALKEAVEKSGTADDKMMEVYQKLQTENTTASPVEADFKTNYPGQFTGCDAQMEAAPACKMQVMQAASTRKTGYTPQPTQQAAVEAVQSAKDAFTSMTAVEKKHQAALSSMREVIASAQKVDTAAVALRSQVGGMNAQQASADENLKKRIEAINSVYTSTYKEIVPKMAQELKSKFVPGYRQVIDTARELDRLQTTGR